MRIGSRSGSSEPLRAIALLALGGACVSRDDALRTGATSLQIAVIAPADLGSDAHRLDDSQRQVTFSVRVLDEQGALDSSFHASVDVYPFYLGTLSGPAQSLAIAGGAGTMTYTMPAAFGPTYLWVEDTSDTSGDRAPTYATGTTPKIWYREPFLEDISTPDLGDTSTWLAHDRLEAKQVRVSGSKHGAAGVLVVTGVYADGFAVSDVDCSTSPCTADPFNHVYVFTFSLARDVNGVRIRPGQTLKWVSGSVGEFNGFTELNFPQQLVDDPTPDLGRIPRPPVLDKAWLKNPSQPTGEINLEKLESAQVQVLGGKVCPLDADYDRYQQWKLDVGWGCGTPINVISAGQVVFDPSTMVGRTLASVVGTVKAVNIGSFNVWILLPRFASDITL
jgi:hypothetical protein